MGVLCGVVQTNRVFGVMLFKFSEFFAWCLPDSKVKNELTSLKRRRQTDKQNSPDIGVERKCLGIGYEDPSQHVTLVVLIV